MQPAAIQGDYVDLKFIKGRKVAVILIEIPMEAADTFVAAFGTPRPAEGVPVALAKMTAPASNVFDKPKRRMAELPLPQQAALLCDREAFWRFLMEEWKFQNIVDAESAAVAVRRICMVMSRSQLATDAKAGNTFVSLRDGFDAWMRTAA